MEKEYIMNIGTLYLIPTPLGEPGHVDPLPTGNLNILNSIDTFIVEEIRTARRFLRWCGITKPIDSLTFLELNEHTPEQETVKYLDGALQGQNLGLLSEAGLPCIADPGNYVVRQAHLRGIRVIPLIGPSSLMLALMASGLNGQQFLFHGYLPIKPHERELALRGLEKDVKTSGRTQIFIETPYRNKALLESIIRCCHPELLLCIAASITTPEEFISTRPVRMWKSDYPELNKKPTVFLFGS